MLVQFTVANYGSIRDEQTVSFVKSGYYSELDEWACPAESPSLKDMSLLMASAIYGANASGKSTILEAVTTMARIVKISSQLMPDALLPYRPFRLDSKHSTTATTFAVVFESNAVRYDYEFSYTAQGIENERLEKYETARRQLVFERSRDDDGSLQLTLTSKTAGLRKFEPFLREKPTSLLLSRAAQEGYAPLMDPYVWMSSRFGFTVPNENDTPSFGPIIEGTEGSEIRSDLVAIISHADLGIVDIKIRNEIFPEDDQLKEMLSEKAIQQLKSMPMKTPVFLHSGSEGDIELDWGSESLGTRTFLSLAANALRALRDGLVFLVDEIDRSLHPALVHELILMFGDKSTNQKGAQLLFTSHDPQIMDYLRRDQIWLVSKSRDGASSVDPLSDYSVRKNEKKSTGYELGRYGAIPYVDSFRVMGGADDGSKS